MSVYICLQCKQEFYRSHARTARRPAQCCSIECASIYRKKLKPKDLEKFVKEGRTLQYMSQKTGVYYNTIARLLRQYGMHREWTINRFSKCAYLRVGNSSATTASSVTTSPSAA
jgi:ribosomal protein S19E (S16A)